MARNLLELPAELLSQALSHLPPGDAARALRACSALAQLGRAGSLWREMLARAAGLELTDGACARDALEQMHTREPACLRFVGLMTDGGVDSPYDTREGDLPDMSERESQYWVTSLFEPTPWLLYCSASGRHDITCAAFLDGYHDAVLEAAEQARRAYMLERLAVIVRDEWHMTIDGFGGLASASPDVLDEAFFAATEIDMGLLLHGISGTIERGAHLLKIRRLRAQIEFRWRSRARPGCVRLKQAELDGRSLTYDAHALARSQTAGAQVAIARRLTVRRPTSCSCPASHGIIYAARERMEPAEVLTDETLLGAKAQLLLSAAGEWVGGPACVEGVGRILRRTRFAEGEIIEVEAPPTGPRGLSPIALFRFFPLTTLQQRHARGGAGQGDAEDAAAGGGDDDGDGGGAGGLAWPAGSGQPSSFLETGLMVAQLVKPRCVRFLVVKLLRAEDRMALCEDDHAETNIDMDFVGLHGHLVDEHATEGEEGGGGPRVPTARGRTGMGGSCSPQ
ncbi:hypothetical protein KFE25_007360 [Diacronema lutheri]|uniref:F-box domain-containing protein n=2 Tax=Diacronema lutheri TaxID=2081491 RepID=A0A8J5XUX1_DIALT|nr:hypothetical protein KFE25_007360 [Diacronema lutheri]